MLSSWILDSTIESSFLASPTSSAILSDLLNAADGASSTIESDSIIYLDLRGFFCFTILLAEELAF
jgi:hypothetical protein